MLSGRIAPEATVLYAESKSMSASASLTCPTRAKRNECTSCCSLRNSASRCWAANCPPGAIAPFANETSQVTGALTDIFSALDTLKSVDPTINFDDITKTLTTVNTSVGRGQHARWFGRWLHARLWGWGVWRWVGLLFTTVCFCPGLLHVFTRRWC